MVVVSVPVPAFQVGSSGGQRSSRDHTDAADQSSVVITDTLQSLAMPQPLVVLIYAHHIEAAASGV